MQTCINHDVLMYSQGDKGSALQYADQGKLLDRCILLASFLIDECLLA